MKAEEQKYYFYRMTTDNGGAPCCTDELWSLAICKPRIRTSARKGDIIVGFSGNDIDPTNGVVHVARITKKLEGERYYDSRSPYRRRPDCIYERIGGKYRLVNRRFHSEEDMDRDLGRMPDRNHANVLLSTEFRYFGNDRYAVDWGRFSQLRAVLDRLRQGERVNHVPEVRTEIVALARELFSIPGSKVLGRPHSSTPGPCNRDDGDDIGCA